MSDSLGNAEIVGGLAIELKYDDAKLRSDLPRIKQEAEAAAKSINVRLPVIIEPQQLRAQLESAIRIATTGIRIRIPLELDTSQMPRLMGGVPLLPGGSGSFNQPTFGSSGAKWVTSRVVSGGGGDAGNGAGRVGGGFGAWDMGDAGRAAWAEYEASKNKGGRRGGGGGGSGGSPPAPPSPYGTPPPEEGGGGGSNFLGRGFGRVVSGLFIGRSIIRAMDSQRQYNIDSLMAGHDPTAQYEALQGRISSSPVSKIAQYLYDPSGNEKAGELATIEMAKLQDQAIVAGRANDQASRDFANAAALARPQNPFDRQALQENQLHDSNLLKIQDAARAHGEQIINPEVEAKSKELAASRGGRAQYRMNRLMEAGKFDNRSYEDYIGEIAGEDQNTLEQLKRSKLDAYTKKYSEPNRLNEEKRHKAISEEIQRQQDLSEGGAMALLGASTKAALLRASNNPRAAAETELYESGRASVRALQATNAPFDQVAAQVEANRARMTEFKAANDRQDTSARLSQDIQFNVNRRLIDRDTLGARIASIRGERELLGRDTTRDRARDDRNMNADIELARQEYYEGVATRTGNLAAAGISANYRARQMPFEAAMAQFAPREAAISKIPNPVERFIAGYALNQERGAIQAEHARALTMDTNDLNARITAAGYITSVGHNMSMGEAEERGGIVKMGANLVNQVIGASAETKELVRQAAIAELEARRSQLIGHGDGTIGVNYNPETDLLAVEADPSLKLKARRISAEIDKQKESVLGANGENPKTDLTDTNKLLEAIRGFLDTISKQAAGLFH